MVLSWFISAWTTFVGEICRSLSNDVAPFVSNCFVNSMWETITRYRGFAEFCQDCAANTGDAKHRILFEAMAAEWRQIAAGHEGLYRRVLSLPGQQSDP